MIPEQIIQILRWSRPNIDNYMSQKYFDMAFTTWYSTVVRFSAELDLTISDFDMIKFNNDCCQ